jgi:DNA-directed RNA polymerase specialized sigma24 family protein
MNGTATSNGDDPADRLETLARFYELTRTRHIRMAGRWVRRFRINEGCLSAEGAVHNVWLKLLARIQQDRTPPSQNLEEFEKTFTPMLWTVILDARRRQNARKRASGDVQSLDSAWDLVDLHAVRPDDGVIAEEQLHLLDGGNANLREVAIMKIEGFSTVSIATQLHVSASTVERMLREIRSILKPHRNDNK